MIPLPTSLYTYAATTLIAGAIAATGAWKVQGWRYGNIIAEHEKAKSQAAIRQAERTIKAQEQANTDNTTIGERHARLQNDIAKLRSQDIDRSRRAADLERLLNTQCTSAGASSMQTNPARGGIDAVPREWTIDHWIKSP